MKVSASRIEIAPTWHELALRDQVKYLAMLNRVCVVAERAEHIVSDTPGRGRPVFLSIIAVLLFVN
jgi:hypothetical protein